MFLFSIKNLLVASGCVLSMLPAYASAQSQSVRAQLSAREVWVGTPVILQLQITDAADYEAPEAPVIDGCRVETAGVPAQSSQITIINGRRSESRSITMQYLITPQRPGTFEVPPLELQVNGLFLCFGINEFKVMVITNCSYHIHGGAFACSNFF